MSLKVLIVDDEPIARDILEAYVAKVPSLELVGTCQNALEAFAALNKDEVDVMLLDINMPEVTGVELIKTLRNPPLVIFTTAYSEYAVESYDLKALDYLLKPIAFDRFVQAINKAEDALSKETTSATTAPDESIFVKTGGKLVKIDLKELLVIEGVKDYIKLHTTNNAILVHSTMKHMEQQLAQYQNLLRVHKSYIVNMNHVHEVEGNMLKLKEHTVVVGNTYKEKVQSILARYKLI